MTDPVTEMVGQIEVDGTYVLASAERDQVALILPGEDHTAFTGRFLHLLRNGVPGGPELLTVDYLYRQLVTRMRAENLSQPQKRATSTADLLALAVNRAFSAAQTSAARTLLGTPATAEPPAPVPPSPLAGPLAGLVDVLVDGRLPRVSEIDPYTLGATPSDYGEAATYGQRDRYVFRTKDGSIAGALIPGRLVVLVGPSKVGKTRTAFEVLRGHERWSHAVLAAPAQRCLGQLAGHPELSNSESLVVWLDDLQRFLPPIEELSQALISRLIDRPGPTVLLATLRTEERERMRTAGELTRERRMVLGLATEIELGSTRQDADERASAVHAYPEVGSRLEGLTETLASGPALLRRYYDAATANPLLHTLVQICIDWARCGLDRPIPEPHLLSLARITLEEERPDLDFDNDGLLEHLGQARIPSPDEGPVALLRTHRLPDRSRGYEAFDYLIAADDGQGNHPARPVPEATWLHLLDLTTDEDAFPIGFAAARRDNLAVALTATRRAAEAGYRGAQDNLGVLLATMHPPKLAEARTWFTRAAQAGHADAQYHLGELLATMHPPKLAEARTWFTRAAQAGHADAQYHLGELLATMHPPELAEARTWFTRAAQAGHADARYYLSRLLATMPAEAVLAIERERVALLSSAFKPSHRDLTFLHRDGRGDLALRFSETFQRLERDPRTAFPAANSERAVTDGGSLDAIRAAREELDAVIEEIRAVPGYEDFLAVPTFEDVAGVAGECPLVYVAAAEPGGLALVVRGADVTHVPLDGLTAEALRERTTAHLEAYAGYRADPGDCPRAVEHLAGRCDRVAVGRGDGADPRPSGRDQPTWWSSPVACSACCRCTRPGPQTPAR